MFNRLPIYSGQSNLSSASSWDQQLTDAIQTCDVTKVRDIVARLSETKEDADRKKIENALRTLVQAPTHTDDAKQPVLKALTGYRGFHCRHIPDFVFDLPASDAQHLIRCFLATGTAPRISKKISTISQEISTFVEHCKNERIERYKTYREEKRQKHNLPNGTLTPYFYTSAANKRSITTNLNFQILEDSKDRFVCRHISEFMRGDESASMDSHKAFKARLNQFDNTATATEALKQIGYDLLEKKFKSDRANPNVVCSNTQFGKMLFKLSGALKDGDVANHAIIFKALSDVHHTITLHIYKNEGKIGIGVHDPNVTANMKHAEYLAEDKEGITALTLQQFMHQSYQDPPDTFAVLNVPKQFADKYAGKLVGEEVQAQVDSVYDALSEDNANHIRAICDELKNKNISGEKLVNLLAKKTNNQVRPGLYLALQSGHAEAVRAFGELLKLLPPESQVAALPNLLAAKRLNGTPGFHMALFNGHAEAVTAFGVLLKLLPEDLQKTALPGLLEAKDNKNIPGLYEAFQQNQAKTVRAFRNLLQLFPEEVREPILFSLLKTHDPEGTPILSRPLEEGNTEAVTACGELLQLLPPKMQEIVLPDLIAAKSFGSTLQKGRAETVKAFGRLHNLLPREALKKLLLDLLVVKGFYQALKNNHAETVKAFRHLHNLLPPEAQETVLLNLLAAKDSNGMSRLKQVLQQGKKTAVLHFVEIVTNAAATFSPKARADLLQMVRSAHGSRKWYALGIWTNDSYYKELIKDQDFRTKFKGMKTALKGKRGGNGV